MIFDLGGHHLGDVLLAAPAMRPGDQVVVDRKHRVPGLPVEWQDSGKGITAHAASKRHMTDAWLIATGRAPRRHRLMSERPKTRLVVAPHVASSKRQWHGWDALRIELPDAEWVGEKEPRCIWMALLNEAHTVICPDTGTAHMADALGCPKVIGLYGHGFEMYAPYWNREHCVVRKGMDAITVDDVMERVLG